MSSAAKPQPAGWLRIAVSGDSMLPTLHNNDMLLLRRSSRFRPGQLVLLEDHAFRLTIKRLSHQIQDQWWVVGDNAEHSIDSRSYGAVSSQQLQAVVIARYWPRPKLFK
jgi:nickel-type superoxide dismutase maturation protease